MSKNYINSHFITKDETIIMGLSGGPDSVFLLYQLIETQKNIPFTLIAAHLNHEWRTTAERDELFCKELCMKFNITFISKKISELDAPECTNSSKEAQGRYYRKYFLESVQQKYNAQKIFLAHHHDDQLETFFIKLIRGTTTEGLSGLKTINKPYYRPLLSLSKQTILEYLQEHHIHYVHDETNDDLYYLRNSIRHKLIPLLFTLDTRSHSNIVRAIDSIKETNEFVETHVEKAYEIIITNNMLDIQLLHTYPLFIQKKVLVRWLHTNNCIFTLSNAFIDEIIRFFNSGKGGVHSLSSSWSLIKKQNRVHISFS